MRAGGVGLWATGGGEGSAGPRSATRRAAALFSACRRCVRSSLLRGATKRPARASVAACRRMPSGSSVARRSSDARARSSTPAKRHSNRTAFVRSPTLGSASTTWTRPGTTPSASSPRPCTIRRPRNAAPCCARSPPDPSAPAPRSPTTRRWRSGPGRTDRCGGRRGPDRAALPSGWQRGESWTAAGPAAPCSPTGLFSPIAASIRGLLGMHPTVPIAPSPSGRA